MSEVFVNKVAESGIISISPESFLPAFPIKVFDLKDYLFMGLILKEKEFRVSLKEMDKTPFADCYVAVTCTADAIIPMWAYMLVATALQSVAKQVMFGDELSVSEQITLENVTNIDLEQYADQRLVIKGCGELPIPESIYLHLTTKLLPVAKSIMYGEPCSTVPVYKKPK